MGKGETKACSFSRNSHEFCDDSLQALQWGSSNTSQRKGLQPLWTSVLTQGMNTQEWLFSIFLRSTWVEQGRVNASTQGGIWEAASAVAVLSPHQNCSRVLRCTALPKSCCWSQHISAASRLLRSPRPSWVSGFKFLLGHIS